jgi:hypothetical protein
MRYFFAKSIAHRTFAGVQFEPCGTHGGGITGVFATDDTKLAKQIAVLVDVEEISEELYLKKKHRLSSPSPAVPAYETKSHLALQGPGAVVVAGDTVQQSLAPPASIDDVLTVREVPV